ncbi:variable large family protein [Borreliella burgdorferi]|uniref:Variable large protein n=1 Tax=Borreliella burgdorferi TaxID=139 RepID=Q5DVG4_BORBG|nr:variable large family protein [Borreliella burgdorferi]CAH61548.1 outer surface protein VlsE [Borreliella burgdorferi]
MKKISSAILLTTFFVFINCKSQVADKDDPTNKFYQSVIQLGNGFLDVFTSFGGLVAEAFGFKSDPKKSDVKTYFTTVAAKLEKTKTDLNSLPKEKSDISSTTGKPDSTGSVGTAVEGAIKEVSELLDKLVKAVKTAEGASSGTAAIGEVVDNAAAAKAADKDSVTGIAKGIKEIVEAAGGSKKLKAAAAKGENNKGAGKLFGKVDAAHGDSEAASKAAGAVSAVSGEQILSAIVKAAAAGDQEGKKPGEAKNPIAAAIGEGDGDAEFNQDGMKKDDQIAAAIALRGMAKDGKFAVKNDEKGKAEGAIKGAAESAVRKVLGAITGLIGDAVSSGLRKVGDSVKAASKETPPALNK